MAFGGWLGQQISNTAKSISNFGEQIPGSPFAVAEGLRQGFSNDVSWNPYSSGNSAWDIMGGGTKLSEDPNNRDIGRTIGTLVAMYFGAGALSGGGGGAAGASSGGAEALGEAGGYGFTSAEAGGATALGEAGGYGMLGDAALSMGSIDSSMAGFDAGAGGVGGMPAGGTSYYDRMREYLRNKWSTTSGTSMTRKALGAYGLFNAMQSKRGYKMPDPGQMPNMPGYQAGMDAVMASMARQGYTGGSNAAAAIGKFGGDFYNQHANQQLQRNQAQQANGMNQIGSLALLLGG